MLKFYSETAQKFYENRIESYKNESEEFKKGYFEACNSCFELEETSVFTHLKEHAPAEYVQGWEAALGDFESYMIEKTGGYGPH